MARHPFHFLHCNQPFFVADPVVMGGGGYGTIYQSKNFVKIPQGPTENLKVECTDEVELEAPRFCNFDEMEASEEILCFKRMDKFSVYKDMSFPRRKAIRRNKESIQTRVNETNNTGNKFFQDNDESYDDNILYAEVTLDSSGKMTSQLKDKSSSCNQNANGGKETQGEKVEKEYLFNPDKRKETVQRVLSIVTATIVFLWTIFDTYTHSSNIQLQPEVGPVFIWSSLVEPLGFMVFVWAIVATIVVGAPFSRLQSAMLMFWGILMLVRSAKSITEVYVPILGILLTGWYVLVEKQPPHEG